MPMTLRRALFAVVPSLLLTGCGSDKPHVTPDGSTVTLSSGDASVVVTLSPFALTIRGADGHTVLSTAQEKGAYGGVAATVDTPYFQIQTLPGWDGYEANESPWRSGTKATVRESTSSHAVLDLEGEGVAFTLDLDVTGARVRIKLDAREHAGDATPGALNKATVAFALGKEERFYGLGERFTSVDHRGLSLYSWPEEGGIGAGENEPAGPTNPYPNGPSMTYFPVPFLLSSEGYGMLVDTTFRSEVHLGSESTSAWRAAVNAAGFATTIYVHDDPLATLSDYTEDTGRPLIPATWVFGVRRRVSPGNMADGTDEWRAMRAHKIAVTGIDDAVHFLPALSQIGREAELMQWTSDLHAAGYKVMAYNNPYVAADQPNAAADYAFGKQNGYFVKGPDGEPKLTEFISGKLLTVAAVDLTNPAAVTWYQGLLGRTLTFGYDGWMHDFGEYTPRDAVFFDGRRGDEVHDEYPVLSAKAAHDLLEKERPGDYLFFVRSGYRGTQGYVPAVWGGDAEATFDETQGLPSAVRGGLNLSMSGVPYWGSDMTGFKCITSAPNDKEIYLRWVAFGAVSPIMMEQDACSNPTSKKTKWKLWNDQETIDIYASFARLHTRLAPYFEVLAHEANATGHPITRHPFLVDPHEPAAREIDDAFWLGSALYAAPVVRRGETTRDVLLPNGRFVDFDDRRVYEGGTTAHIAAPLSKLPLFLAAEQILPLLDPSVETLATATDPTVVTAAKVADRLDVIVALPTSGSAKLVLADGTELTAERAPGDAGNGSLSEVMESAISDCASCFVTSSDGDVNRLRANSSLASGSELRIADLKLTVKGGPARRVRWDVLRLK
ncbi:Alpha-xylosidase [Minicystis rosea]|nr:Alpha-xylosidase [Minicystis rosea]